MSEKRIYEKYKGTTNEPGVIDTEFAYPIMYRLQLLYDRKFRENRGEISKVKIKKFGRFIGKIFDISVPRIRVVKKKKIEKRFGKKDILGVCITRKERCNQIWLQKEMVKSGDGKLIYATLMHELRHCWQGEDYDYYYGENGDTKELQELREADAQAFTELIFYYLFEGWYSYEIQSPEEAKQREQIENIKDDIRTDLWKQIKKYYFWHGDIRTFFKIKKMDQTVYRKRGK